MFFCIIGVKHNVELKELDRLNIYDWYGVGLQLNLQPKELNEIRQDYSNFRTQAREMFSKWLKQDPERSYQKVANALLKTGDTAQAHELARAKGMAL